MDAFLYVIGLLLVVALPPGVTWWLLVHPFVGFWRRLGAGVTMTVMTSPYAAIRHPRYVEILLVTLPRVPRYVPRLGGSKRAPTAR